jgi:hypothetical protein
MGIKDMSHRMDTQAHPYRFRDTLPRVTQVRDDPPPADAAEDRASRLAAHERRIHNHPCSCGSGKRYADCCIGKINQTQIELRHRRRLARRRRRAEVAA